MLAGLAALDFAAGASTNSWSPSHLDSRSYWPPWSKRPIRLDRAFRSAALRPRRAAFPPPRDAVCGQLLFVNAANTPTSASLGRLAVARRKASAIRSSAEGVLRSANVRQALRDASTYVGSFRSTSPEAAYSWSRGRHGACFAIRRVERDQRWRRRGALPERVHRAPVQIRAVALRVGLGRPVLAIGAESQILPQPGGLIGAKRWTRRCERPTTR